MKRFFLGGGLLVGLALSAAALAAVLAPAIGVAIAPRAGVEVQAAEWCDAGVCLEGITFAGARAERAVIAWDRSVHVTDVHVPMTTLMERGTGGPVGALSGGTPEGGGGWVRMALTTVDVEGLVVEGAPLPVLSGRIWPDRALTGTGVSITGDVVEATLQTDLGEVRLEVRQEPEGIGVVARCGACQLPAPSALDPAVVLPPVEARGVYRDGAFVGSITTADVRATVVTRREDGVVLGTLTLPPTPLAALLPLALALAPEAAPAQLGGTLSATAEVRWPGGLVTFDPKLEDFSVSGLVPGGLAGGPFQFRARDAEDNEVFVQTGEGTPAWVPLARMGPWLPAAVIATEDASFPWHPGYDLTGMQEAAAKNVEAGAIVRGGSTLTQQLAKNLFLTGTRSYSRKLRELLMAVELEQELGKQRILEVYLNIVEFGPGLRGARAAADTYFLKAPEGLLPEEAAWLASILRFPRTAYRKQYLAGTPDESRVDWILTNLQGVPEAERLAALERPVRLVPP